MAANLIELAQGVAHSSRCNFTPKESAGPRHRADAQETSKVTTKVRAVLAAGKRNVETCVVRVKP